VADSSVPPASRQHSSYAVHIEQGPVEKELVLVNVSGRNALVAITVNDVNGQYNVSQPRRGFMPLPAHAVLRVPVTQVMGFNTGDLGRYIRVEDPLSVVVGAIINRDTPGRRFLTVYPLIPDLAQDGQEVTRASLSRIQIDAGSGATTSLFIVNPNDNPVNFKASLTDPAGNVTETPVFSVLTQGTFTRAQSSLVPNLFSSANQGHVRVEVQDDPRPGTSERLIFYSVYRGQRFLSAVPAQR